MRFFITTVGMVCFAAILFILGALSNSSVLMMSMMCLVLPIAIWLNGFAASKANIRIVTDESNPAPRSKGFS